MMIDLASIIDELEFDDVEIEAPDNSLVGDAPLLDNGLNLMYAPQNYGKSYTAIAIALESKLPTIFFDMESNGKMFVNFCKKNNVAYAYIGSVDKPIYKMKKIIERVQKKYRKILVIIDSYSDMFPNDDGKMSQESQKSLGDIHKYFMREVECPALILDHATEQPMQILKDGKKPNYKIEGNKSGKFKKTVCVLRLDLINNDLENGTWVKVERSRNQDKLPIGTSRHFPRNNYLTIKIQAFIDDGRLNEEFKNKDLENVLTGDERKLWRNMRDEITINRKISSSGRGKSTILYKLNKRE